MLKGINLAVAALLGLLIACAPDGHQAVAQSPAQQQTSPLQLPSFDPFNDPDFFIFDPFPVDPGDAYDIKAQNHARRKKRAIKSYIGAVNALAKGDSSGFARYRGRLQASAQDSNNRLDHPDIVVLARGLLASLPETYTPGFAYRRADGTVSRDPSPYIQYFLRREGDLASSGGDGAAAD